jgi:GTP-binding protein YchF
MKLGLIGLPQSGKSTVFAALTGARGDKKGHAASSGNDPRIATVTVFDDRVDFLKEVYQPKKTTYTKIEYMVPTQMPASSVSKSEAEAWNQVRVCDALLHVVRNFSYPGGPPPTPEQDFWQLEEELVLNDLMVTEKRLERIELDKKRGKKPEGEEYSLLESCREILERGDPLRKIKKLASEPALRGFTFLSAKPMLVIINNDDEDQAMPKWDQKPEDMELMVVRGRLEMDIAAMSPEEAEEFQEAYNIQESALDRVIRASYHLQNRISFFTVLSDEVRAWSIIAGTPALEAAGTVHSDMKKGFIRAETLSFEDLRSCGTFQEAKKAGLVRLEGKDYEVKDGDIINFRFNV